MSKTITNKYLGMGASVALAAIILAGVFWFMSSLKTNTTKEAEVNITGESFEIKGMYGKTFNFKDVTSMEVKDTIPAVGRKNNGTGLGNTKKGYFEVDGMGECLLFLEAEKGPFLYIKTSSTVIIMNYKQEEKTKQLYEDLMSNWKK